MTDGDTVLILPCETQFVTVQAAAMYRYNDVSPSIQSHSERTNYINVNLGVHNFFIKISPSATMNTQKLCARFLVRTLVHLRRAKCINARGDSNTRHET